MKQTWWVLLAQRSVLGSLVVLVIGLPLLVLVLVIAAVIAVLLPMELVTALL